MKQFFRFSILFIFFVCSSISGKASDPYQWLEQIESAEVQGWVRHQDDATRDYLTYLPYRDEIQDLVIRNSALEQCSVPKEVNENLYFLLRHADEDRNGLYRMDPSGQEIALVIPDAPNFLTGYSLSPDGKYLAYGLSDSGSDFETWHFLDLSSGELLNEQISDIKFSKPMWNREGTGVYYARTGTALENSQNNGLYYYELDHRQEEVCLIDTSGNPRHFLGCIGLVDDNTLLFCTRDRENGQFSLSWLHLEEGKVEQLIESSLNTYQFVGKLEHSLVFQTNDGAPFGKVVCINFETGEWNDVVLESQMPLVQVCLAKERVICAYIEGCHSVLKVYDLEGQYLCDVPLPGGGTVIRTNRGLHLTCSSDWSQLYFGYTDFTTPTTLYQYDLVHEELSLLRSALLEQKQGFEVTQVYFPSSDGTEIPMYIVHKEGLELSGNHPTLMYGYGGFNSPITPLYSPLIMTWLELGGVYASVNLRGGGEFGTEWHEAGRLHNKQNVFDDFIAAGEWLISHGYTNCQKLAINGRSNGGLLVGACLVQRPDLFAAAIPQVGVHDMLNFPRFTIGWAWTGDFGDPNNPEDFDYLLGYSPYHNVADGVRYPATLVTTADHDDRVVPSHSYKFTARLQQAQVGEGKILLREYQNSGHLTGLSKCQGIEEDTDILSFLFNLLF